MAGSAPVPVPDGAAMPIIVLGAGGHARVVVAALRVLRTFHPLGVLDRTNLATGETVAGAAIVGGFADLERFAAQGAAAALAIGDNRERAVHFDRCRALGLALPAIVHPAAVVDTGAVVEDGALVCMGAIVGVQARIGRGAIVNTGAVIDHESVLDDFAHVGPGARIAGRVVIGSRAFVGIGACVIDRIAIGADATVGAGAAVIAPVAEAATVVGVPAREIRRG